ncbi:MAG: linear amide C-N hydrolase [Clostridia bacterium]|nr:linear amide C-N hydrolase [Clostridia bacterium]
MAKKSTGGKSAKIALSVIISFILLIMLITSAAIGVFWTELAAIRNIEQIDDYGFFVMEYKRDYNLDHLLSVGASSDQELIDYIVKQIFKGIPIKIDMSDYACTTFNSVTAEGEYLFARNFDWEYSPSLMVWTAPDNGYASISMVNLGFLAYAKDYLPDKYFNRFLTLAAPYVPVDGMNEAGLAIGVLYLEAEPTAQDTGKIGLTTTTMIRLVLDKAATVAEAIALFEAYDMHDSAGACYHYQIADATGASVIIEYIDNEMTLIYPEHNDGNAVDFQMAANFFITPDVSDIDLGIERYTAVKDALTASNGLTTKEEAMALLQEVRLDNYIEESGFINDTQWSAVYDLTNRTLNICIGMNYETIYSFAIDSPMQIK